MVKHILADGREVDSIEGFVIPPTGATEVVYRIVIEHCRKRSKANKKENEARKSLANCAS